jgi:redox-sensitive bicupin YhaK (pirin superfamily)
MGPLIRAAERHATDHGWLQSRFLFSFADYYDEDNLSFGAVRVFNDDRIAPGTGFGAHPHRDMEIVTVVLDGVVTHRDSMGNAGEIPAGDVQRMSAGRGITHSEHNRSAQPLHLYQIWFLPRHLGATPSYAQRSFRDQARRNRLLPVVSGHPLPGALSMDADATLSIVDLEPGQDLRPLLQAAQPGFPGHALGGTLIYVSAGAARWGDTDLAPGDQLRLPQRSDQPITTASAATLIIIEV